MLDLIQKYNFKKVKDITAEIYVLQLEDVKLYIFGNDYYNELSVTTKDGCYNMSTTICSNDKERYEKLIRAFLPVDNVLVTALREMEYKNFNDEITLEDLLNSK